MKKMVVNLVLLMIAFSLNGQHVKRADDLNGLDIGVKAPLFKVIDAKADTFSLENTLKENAVVLIFYRGFWCPYCNKHLEIFQDSLSLIEEYGARVVAISPEKPEYLTKMGEKTGATFTLLYDDDYLIAQAYDVLFTPSKMQIFSYNNLLGAGLKKSHSDDSQRLPIPASYLIDKNGIIVWRHFDPNYKKRSTVKEILRELKEMN